MLLHIHTACVRESRRPAAGWPFDDALRSHVTTKWKSGAWSTRRGFVYTRTCIQVCGLHTENNSIPLLPEPGGCRWCSLAKKAIVTTQLSRFKDVASHRRAKFRAWDSASFFFCEHSLLRWFTTIKGQPRASLRLDGKGPFWRAVTGDVISGPRGWSSVVSRWSRSGDKQKDRESCRFVADDTEDSSSRSGQGHILSSRTMGLRKNQTLLCQWWLIFSIRTV